MASVRPVPVRYGERDVYTVASFNGGIAGWLERLPAVWVEGEVSELRRQPGWAYVRFTLCDLLGGASVPVQMHRTTYDRLAPLRDGDRVHVHGRAKAWPRTGSLSLHAFAVEPYGLGRLLRDLELLKARLAADGLFAADRKRPLPPFPRLIGLICGRDAAAKHDVVSIATARFPAIRFRIEECAVQGGTAPAEVCAALRRLDADPLVEVIVLARGGGSVEDLATFSDEGLCRALAACATPTVSAIGHEQDAPLCDLVADFRAATPTHAAKVIVPDAAALRAACAALPAGGRAPDRGGAKNARRARRPAGAAAAGRLPRLAPAGALGDRYPAAGDARQARRRTLRPGRGGRSPARARSGSHARAGLRDRDRGGRQRRAPRERGGRR